MLPHMPLTCGTHYHVQSHCGLSVCCGGMKHWGDPEFESWFRNLLRLKFWTSYSTSETANDNTAYFTVPWKNSATGIQPQWNRKCSIKGNYHCYHYHKHPEVAVTFYLFHYFKQEEKPNLWWDNNDWKQQVDVDGAEVIAQYLLGVENTRKEE